MQLVAAVAVLLFTVFRRSGVVRQTTTDRAGRYRIVLAAGLWRVSLTRSGFGSSIEPGELRALADRTRKVDLSLDTGIR